MGPLKFYGTALFLFFLNKSVAEIYINFRDFSLRKVMDFRGGSPSIRFCCPRKNLLAGGKCGDGLIKEIETKFVFRIGKHGKLERKLITMLSLNIMERTPFFECVEMLSLKTDDYMLFKDGRLRVHSRNTTLNQEDYCLYPHQIWSDLNKTIRIVLGKCSAKLRPAAREITMVSMVCCILTIAVYLYVKKLRNVIGKCIICSLFSLIMSCLISMLDSFRLLDNICSLAGYNLYFFDFAYHLWNSVISYQLWKELKSMSISRDEPRYRFLGYSLFVWSSAAIPTGVIFLMNHFWEKDPHKWDWMPLVGYMDCSVNIDNWSAWIYYHGPLLAINTFNVAFFTLTAVHIVNVRRKLNSFKGTMTCVKFNKLSNLLFLRISVIMGVSWIFNLVSFWVRLNSFWQEALKIADYYHYALGIITFVLLILKPSTLNLLMDRIRGIRG